MLVVSSVVKDILRYVGFSDFACESSLTVRYCQAGNLQACVTSVCLLTLLPLSRACKNAKLPF